MKSTLSIGQKAPDFTLPATNDQLITLGNYINAKVVLYFYPRDGTPGCTKQAESFNALADDFERSGATIIGVSTDTLESHENFAKKLGLTIILASDAETLVSGQYGVWVAKKMYGRSFMGIERTTFLINRGEISRIWRKVRVAGHAEAVLEAVNSAG